MIIQKDISAQELEKIYAHSWHDLSQGMKKQLVAAVPCKEWRHVNDTIQRKILKEVMYD